MAARIIAPVGPKMMLPAMIATKWFEIEPSPYKLTRTERLTIPIPIIKANDPHNSCGIGVRVAAKRENVAIQIRAMKPSTSVSVREAATT